MHQAKTYRCLHGFMIFILQPGWAPLEFVHHSTNHATYWGVKRKRETLCSNVGASLWPAHPHTQTHSHMQSQKQVSQETSQLVRWERRTSPLAHRLLSNKNHGDPHSSQIQLSSVWHSQEAHNLTKSHLWRHVADTPTHRLQCGLNRKSTNQS